MSAPGEPNHVHEILRLRAALADARNALTEAVERLETNTAWTPGDIQAGWDEELMTKWRAVLARLDGGHDE